jgi:hypothetical protein
MVELVDYRVSYGECVGYCTSVLTIDGPAIELVQTSNGPDGDERRFTGEIDPALSHKIAAEAAELQQEVLSKVYGTPDARDEGAVTVRIRGRAGVTEHRYSRGGPPGELSNLDDLLSPILLGWIDGDAPLAVHFKSSP